MKLKIFDYVWHVPHQFDMLHALKDDCDFFFVPNIKSGWDFSKRSLPHNVTFVSHYEPKTYDVAILHIDQRAVHSGLVRRIYKEFENYITDIPKIVINHGSPVLTEWFNAKYPHSTSTERMNRCRAEVKALVKKNLMVVNSYTASSSTEWGFGRPIVHGINPRDFYDLPKDRRVFTALSPGGFDDYYNRDCLNRVSKILAEKYDYELKHARVNVETDTPILYKRYLGASLIYFDPSFRTPMNRARTEAFLSGCCVVQVEGAHDLDRWAKHGENIILVPNNPADIGETIIDLLENRYDEATAIGQAGKKMAREQFSVSSYRNEWLEVFNELLN